MKGHTQERCPAWSLTDGSQDLATRTVPTPNGLGVLWRKQLSPGLGPGLGRVNTAWTCQVSLLIPKIPGPLVATGTQPSARGPILDYEYPGQNGRVAPMYAPVAQQVGAWIADPDKAA